MGRTPMAKLPVGVVWVRVAYMYRAKNFGWHDLRLSPNLEVEPTFFHLLMPIFKDGIPAYNRLSASSASFASSKAEPALLAPPRLG